MEQKEPKPIDQEVIDNLNKIGQAFDSLTMEMGALEVESLRLANRKSYLVDQFNQLLEDEAKYHAELLEKYGKGSIDVEKKVFIPE
jgi:hypothetical protein